MRKLKYGGQIVPGDFVAISYQNHMDFGWYAGNGINDTLQYYSFRNPGDAYDRYEEWLKMDKKDQSAYWAKRYYINGGFTRKCLWKSYINAVHSTRVIKITNIEDIFTEPEDRMKYEKSREALIKLNLIKQ
jgi:hypothetical protein